MIRSRGKKRLIFASSALLLSLLSLAVWAVLVEPNQLVINEQTITLPSWPNSLSGFKIAVISDIHAGSPFIRQEKLQQVVATANATNPDLIVLLGDFMTLDRWFTSPIEPEVIAGILKGLHARFGVYAVMGNHDWWYDGNRVWGALDAGGIKVLENDVAQLQANGHSFWLVGLADLWTRPQDIRGTLQKAPEGEIVIALTHNPDIFPDLPVTVDLTLAGHTHGGQVNFPFIGRPVVPSEYGQKYAAGYIQQDGKHLFVTTGIGTSVFPLRFRVPPEIAVLELRSAASVTSAGVR